MQTARRAEQRSVFRFSWLPISARGQSGYSMGRFALPKCAAYPCQLRENGCPFRAGGGRAAEGEAVFPLARTLGRHPPQAGKCGVDGGKIILAQGVQHVGVPASGQYGDGIRRAPCFHNA